MIALASLGASDCVLHLRVANEVWVVAEKLRVLKHLDLIDDVGVGK